MLRDLVIQNRSYRGYDRSVRMTHEELLKLVDLARISASSMNRQVLRFHVASDELEVEKIQKLTVWARGLPELNLPYPGTEPTGFIVICLDHDLDHRNPNFLKDVGIVAQTMLLGAVEKGFGGCMIGSINIKALSELLGLPEHIEPSLAIAFGKPAEKVILTDVKDNQTNYFRDDTGKTHYVPKRALEDLLI